MKAIMRDAAELKDSGIEWIGNIPSSWHIMKISRLFELIGSGTTPKSTRDEYYNGTINWLQSGDINGGYVNFTDKKISKDICENNTALTIYAPPFIVIAMYGASIGNISIVNIEACTNQACCVLSFPNEIMNLNYLFYQLKSAKDEMLLSSRGGTQPNISQAIIRQMRVAVPSYKEQQYIANYLDDRCSKIDAIIAEAKASIEEYKELKQTVIYEAVTKGLDKNVEMKDSGNIWYGLIPKHWELHKVCWDYSVELGKMLDQKRISGKNLRPYLRNADVKWDNINFEDLPEMDFGEDELERYNVQPGDLMICEGGEIGKCNIVPQDCPKGIYYQKALHRVRAYKSSVSKYLRYLIMFLSKSGYINDSAQKATIFHLPAEKLKALRIPTPSVKEQTDIATYLDARTSDIDNLLKLPTPITGVDP